MKAFQEHVLNAPDVCNSCFRRIRVERDVTESTDRKSMTSTSLSAYSRDRQTTSVEHAPSETASESVAVFCECGSETAFERYWSDGEDRCLTMARFKELLKHCIYSLESKGVTIDRKAMARHAIGTYRDSHEVNEALGTGLEAGITASVTSGRGKTAPLAD